MKENLCEKGIFVPFIQWYLMLFCTFKMLIYQAKVVELQVVLALSALKKKKIMDFIRSH